VREVATTLKFDLQPFVFPVITTTTTTTTTTAANHKPKDHGVEFQEIKITIT
jgi:hypothetical protein